MIRYFLFIGLVFCFRNTNAQSLQLTGATQWVNIGDLDVSGTQLTVEALINRQSGVNVVSKHTDPSNVNYLLRPTTFELTTTSQFYLMSNPFTLQSNTWYHIAGTYDGNSIKYYVNGCLVIEQPATGNIVQNNLATAIGNQSSCQCEQFVGLIDEVRIWNVARTQAQIQANMNNLPNPATQVGLLAYYNFNNNLNNIQGNATFNGNAVGPISFGPEAPNISPFQIQDVLVENVSCFNGIDGKITAIASGNGLEYSLDGVNYTTNNVFENLPAGTYTIYIRSLEGCVLAESDVEITQPLQLQAPDINSNSPVCLGDNIELTAQNLNNVQYVWSGPNGFSSNLQNPIIENSSNNNAGQYSVFFVFEGCTSLVANTVVELKPIPETPTAFVTHPICETDTLFFSATGNNNANYTWTSVVGQNQFTGQSFFLFPANASYNGNYILQAEIDGCFSEEVILTVHVDTLPQIIAITNNSPVCEGEVLTLSIESIGGSGVLWNGPNNFNSINNLLNINTTQNSAGTYTVTVFNGACVIEESTQAVINNNPETPIDIIYEGDCALNYGFTVLNLSGDTTQIYNWVFGEDTEVIVGPYINFHQYSSVGQYEVAVNLSTIDGCTSEFKKLINVEEGTLSLPEIPNVITPNGDGVNDVFQLDALFFQCFPSDVFIFNRWGNLIFKSEGGTVPFNGKDSSGKELSQGVYFYVIKGANFEQNGTLTIVY